VIPFVPNAAQRRLLERLWYRTIILKARQLGFTSLVAIMWLDQALFNADQRCGIIAHDRKSAEVIFRDKVKLAYERLPDELRERMPLARDSASELLFAHNNSSIRVATSMRSGTIHRLHVSEFGKICATYRDKAREVVTGSLPAVPVVGIAVIESTAQGQDGDFYTMTQHAMGPAEQRMCKCRQYCRHLMVPKRSQCRLNRHTCADGIASDFAVSGTRRFEGSTGRPRPSRSTKVCRLCWSRWRPAAWCSVRRTTDLCSSRRKPKVFAAVLATSARMHLCLGRWRSGDTGQLDQRFEPRLRMTRKPAAMLHLLLGQAGTRPASLRGGLRQWCRTTG
jgi:hypothetical protein